mmetsp:Transcript_48646/g.135957  ORF Transcript_48646/g.135957 Transcript_48646/m.135957 type:complete len:405 (-) Transcript_48646:121-1335(-)|eukprot:CAMPEP_0117549812 /NCGR_PEP_ID=MMETSP0784-20121206/48359_1 /TAXON_ID=39447 /ORGANISM="" /LENGTH=404 /DNA_ID=CAMNT_0005346813 /DNA_START=217 /DNA_END=1431 /DNA_ORIENTATION=-
MEQRCVQKYLEICRGYQVMPSSDVLTYLRMKSQGLRVHRLAGAKPFGDLELHPLVDVLENDAEALGRLRSLDLSNAQLGPSGAALVAHVFSLPGCAVESLDFSRQRPGAEGVAALVQAARRTKCLRSLRVKSCHFGDVGGSYFAELFEQLGDAENGLRDVDLQNNWLGFDVCQRIESAAKARKVQVHLSGNQILDEVLNAVSHGLGCVLAIVGSVFLGLAVYDKPRNYKMAVVLYSLALHVLYFASTLYHSLHATGPTVMWVFGILDHAAIYLLIAGSYCPFLWIFFPNEVWAARLLLILWTMALVGMGITAFYTGPKKSLIETSLYLAMGWSALTCVGDMFANLGPQGTRLLVFGGILYTGGVPFFVKGGRTFGIPDHTIWHIFVLAGSVAHYFCILLYCVVV